MDGANPIALLVGLMAGITPERRAELAEERRIKRAEYQRRCEAGYGSYADTRQGRRRFAIEQRKRGRV